MEEKKKNNSNNNNNNMKKNNNNKKNKKKNKTNRNKKPFTLKIHGKCHNKQRKHFSLSLRSGLSKDVCFSGLLVRRPSREREMEVRSPLYPAVSRPCF